MSKEMPKIWVDADACPKAVKEILIRASQRTKTVLIFVANRLVPVPAASWIQSIQVASGFDSADKYIVSQIAPKDLLISSDIPLAYDALQKQAYVINHVGERYSENEIKQRLSIRHINEQIRSLGQRAGGSAPMGIKEKTAFANALDRWLSSRG